MNQLQRRVLSLWAVLLAAFVCFIFVPVSNSIAALLTVAGLVVAAAIGWGGRRAPASAETMHFNGLPGPSWRQPVVLVCGETPSSWPENVTVLTVAEGCWIRVESDQEVNAVAQQLLMQRPEWGRQLSVMVTAAPQQYRDADAITHFLLSLRWRISVLRREVGHPIPVVVQVVVGSSLVEQPAWQATLAENADMGGHTASVSYPITPKSNPNSEGAFQQQVLFNSLKAWLNQYVCTVLALPHPDMPAIVPNALIAAITPSLTGAAPDSVWSQWLQQKTGIRFAHGLAPAMKTGKSMPDFILTLLPENNLLMPRQRVWRGGLVIFTVAALLALCCSGWNNRQLLYRVSFDIHHYNRIAMRDDVAKAAAVDTLLQDAALLDKWARYGEPASLSLGLYQGERMRTPLMEAIRSYRPPTVPPAPVKSGSTPTLVRLDSMSLFDSGKAVLRNGSTKMLVTSLVDIKARPGWLIVVSGHTDNTGNAQLNQALSLKRAEAVRDWMRDTGDVPESCFAVQGYGASRPVASNDSPEGRAQNRRVDISLMPQADACQAADYPLAPSTDDGADNTVME